MPRCGICGSIMLVSEYVIDIDHDNEGCDHCHEVNCRDCVVRYGVHCPICGNNSNLHEDLVKCDKCNNMKQLTNQCFWCRSDPILIRYVKTLYPYFDDADKLARRKNYAHYMRNFPLTHVFEQKDYPGDVIARCILQ